MYTGTERRNKQTTFLKDSSRDRRWRDHKYPEEDTSDDALSALTSAAIASEGTSFFDNPSTDSTPDVSVPDTPSSDFGGFGGGDSGGGGASGDY